MPASPKFCLRSLGGFSLGLLSIAPGCATDTFEDFGPPPAEDSFNPEGGSEDGGGYTTYGGDGDNGSGGDGDGGSVGDGDGDGATECEDPQKRCPTPFSLADSGYGSVSVMGDFAADGWSVGVPMTLADGVWSASVLLPWDTTGEYKFKADGDNWFPDPANPNTVPDGQGGQNSVYAATTCEDFECDPGNIGTFDWRDAVIYFAFVDRFLDGDPSNNAPIGVENAADWQGGDWAGIVTKIQEGYFTDLGVNTLWLTVPLDNADGFGAGTDGYDYSAYHGYWPQNMDSTEARFGTLEELQNMVQVAHDNDLKVIFDYAMNHVHDSSPVYTQNPGWFWPNDNGQGGDCVCGSGCDWNGDQGRRCWFTPYLPDFNFTNSDARQFSIDNALQWIADSGCDGYRLDAVKHIEDQWLLDLRSRVSAEVESQTGEHFYMVGETYTGDRDLIAYYVNSAMLDGQFDFPMRMEIANKVLMRNGAMSDLANFFGSNDNFYGAGIMSTFVGNHDIPRVIHLAEDVPLWDNEWADGKDRAWNNKPGLPSTASAFERLAVGFAIIMTSKGAPLIYYGDEIGLPGAGDPDNRRFMQWSGYSTHQELLFDKIATMTSIRAEHPALRRGTRSVLSSGQDTMAYRMTTAGDEIIVALNRADTAADAGGIPAGNYTDLLGGGNYSGPTLSVPARTALILAAQ